MAEEKEPFEALTTTAAQTAEQITKQTQGAMENYFGWLQNTMSTLPWSNTNLNRILLNNATENVTATFAFMHKLSQAKNFQEVVQILQSDPKTDWSKVNIALRTGCSGAGPALSGRNSDCGPCNDYAA